MSNHEPNKIIISKMLYFNLGILLFYLMFSIGVYAQNAKNNKIPTLTYEELIQNKEQYLGETVRVKAFYVWGFEWQFLCGKDCKTRRHETWVEFGDLCKSSKKQKKGNDKLIDNKAEVVFEGVLSEGHFGHQNGYKFQFTVSCVEKNKLVTPN